MKLSNHVFMMHRQYRHLSDTFLITLLLITSRSRKIYRSKHDKYNISLSLVINREIFIPNREIGRFSLFYQKSGDLPQNRDTWKLCVDLSCLLGHNKHDNSFWSQPNSRLTLWRGFFLVLFCLSHHNLMIATQYFR